MKRRAVLAVVTWVLIVPSAFHGASGEDAQWSNAEQFESHQECESARRVEQDQAKRDLDSGKQTSLGSTDPLTPAMRDLAVRWLRALCVSSSGKFPEPGTLGKRGDESTQGLQANGGKNSQADSSKGVSSAAPPSQDRCNGAHAYRAPGH